MASKDAIALSEKARMLGFSTYLNLQQGEWYVTVADVRGEWVGDFGSDEEFERWAAGATIHAISD